MYFEIRGDCCVQLDHVTRRHIHHAYLLYALTVRMNLAMMHDERSTIMMNDVVRVIWILTWEAGASLGAGAQKEWRNEREFEDWNWETVEFCFLREKGVSGWEVGSDNGFPFFSIVGLKTWLICKLDLLYLQVERSLEGVGIRCVVRHSLILDYRDDTVRGLPLTYMGH